ncbi:NADP-dependent oxidoreductase [Lapidilactobacillus wuchangensis]|uniref:NADP-dependent oxidoreductase n=1 Tax=Lapidilactobacillus wuchangensis TaxID=2486001 RepID=UPI000F7A8073|nr:NADP-dependent oxidoreductase [Lapidilactobacillus wuchangensis]
MKSFGFTNYGGPDVIQEFERDIPTPKTNQVLIKVAAFAINPYEGYLRQGQFSNGQPLTAPFYLGSDLVGQIVAVDPSVTDYQVGDWVINHRAKSGYSQYVTASTNKIMRRPLTLPVPIAASLPTTGIAAYNAWYHFANIKPTDQIAIIGVTGGVGSLLAQIALYNHQQVLGIANHRHEKVAHELGVQNFLAYDQLPSDTSWQHQQTVVFNTLLGGHDHGLANQLLAPKSQLICFNDNDIQLTAPAAEKITIHYRGAATDHETFEFWTKYLAERSLQIAIDQVRPATLANVRDAHASLTKPHFGKQVLTWAD